MHQEDSFYEEAENLSPGWGKYLRRIDDLREKYENKEPIELKDACWIFYAESEAYSSTYLKFIDLMKELGFHNMEAEYEVWKTILKWARIAELV